MLPLDHSHEIQTWIGDNSEVVLTFLSQLVFREQS
jgi:hypothetical protein